MKMTAASQMASPNLAPTSTVSSDCLLSQGTPDPTSLLPLFHPNSALSSLN